MRWIELAQVQWQVAFVMILNFRDLLQQSNRINFKLFKEQGYFVLKYFVSQTRRFVKVSCASRANDVHEPRCGTLIYSIRY